MYYVQIKRESKKERIRANIRRNEKRLKNRKNIVNSKSISNTNIWWKEKNIMNENHSSHSTEKRWSGGENAMKTKASFQLLTFFSPDSFRKKICNVHLCTLTRFSITLLLFLPLIYFCWYRNCEKHVCIVDFNENEIKQCE